MKFEEIENIGKDVQKYIVVDGDRLYFDYEKAQENYESQDLIEQGLLLESVSDSYSKLDNKTYGLRSIELPIWGIIVDQFMAERIQMNQLLMY